MNAFVVEDAPRLRPRRGGYHLLRVRRAAPHHPRIKPTSGGKACGVPALRGGSAAPLGRLGWARWFWPAFVSFGGAGKLSTFL
jgi:hypothetical protein